MTLEEIRKDIDSVDAKLVALFEERMKLAKEVALNKKETGKAVYDKERELVKLSAVEQQVTKEENKQGIHDIFTQIMAVSRKYQYTLLSQEETKKQGYTYQDTLQLGEDIKVAYQGIKGANNEQAMVQFFGEDVHNLNVDKFEDVLIALEEGRADYGVLPVENSSAGAVAGVFDMITAHNVWVVGEEIVKVNHALLGVKGAKLEDIEVVYSHPQGLLQCAQYLNEAGFRQVSLSNTAVSAKKVADEQDKTQAAVASERAAKLYGLEILKDHINFDATNSTRFYILTKKKIVLKDSDKIGISFQLPHECGSLYTILSHFAFNGLNLTSIMSTPLPNKPWEYRFFVEFKGNLLDPAVKNAITGIKEETTEFRILGNY